MNNITGANFPEYLVSKYGGKKIEDKLLKRVITVRTTTDSKGMPLGIYDLRFEDLDIGDQKLALHPEIGWAWGVWEGGKTLEQAKEVRGFLYRPKQRAFIHAPERYPLYIGAFGSGKSLILWIKCLQNCMAYPGTVGLFMRATYPQMEKSLLTFRKIASHFGWREGKEFKHNIGKHFITFNNGSEIHYMPAKTDGATLDETIQNLRSFEMDFIALDEIVDIPEGIFMTSGGRVGRWGKIPEEERHQVIGAGNPPSSGSWIHKRWYLKREDKNKPLSNPEEYGLWVSSTYENMRNLPAAYLRDLENKPDWYREAYLYGRLSFQPPDGTPVFGDFDYGTYVAKERLEPHEDLPIIRGHDLGPTSKNKACVIGQIDPRGVLLIFAEVLVEDIGIGTYIERVIEVTNQLFPGSHEIRDFTDPVAFDPSQTDHKSAADIAREYGIRFYPGEEKTQIRLEAVSKMMHRLSGDGVPGIYIDRRCEKLIQGFMGGYRYKVTDVEHKRFSMSPVKDEYSHVMDALQYLCTRVTHVQNINNPNSVRAKAKKRNSSMAQKRKLLLSRSL